MAPISLSIRRVCRRDAHALPWAKFGNGAIMIGRTVTGICVGLFALSLGPAWARGADKIRIGVSNYNISNLTVGVAQTQNFFRQEGIEAEIIRMNPNVATMALVSGDIDYSTLVGSVVGANLKGAPVKMIACSQDRTPLSLVSKAAIKSVKELKGKTIGVGSYGSTPDIIARLVVKHYGVDPETEIKMLALGTDTARLTALKEGMVDAIIVAPPADYEGKNMGFNILSRAADILRFPYNGLAASMKKLSEKPDEVKRVIRAIVRANGFIRRIATARFKYWSVGPKPNRNSPPRPMNRAPAFSARTERFLKTVCASSSTISKNR
jgi:ABC-type nitrate/sulfonate/bicarbonate transport system substrate-binding protein